MSVVPVSSSWLPGTGIHGRVEAAGAITSAHARHTDGGLVVFAYARSPTIRWNSGGPAWSPGLSTPAVVPGEGGFTPWSPNAVKRNEARPRGAVRNCAAAVDPEPSETS